MHPNTKKIEHFVEAAVRRLKDACYADGLEIEASCPLSHPTGMEGEVYNGELRIKVIGNRRVGTFGGGNLAECPKYEQEIIECNANRC